MENLQIGLIEHRYVVTIIDNKECILGVTKCNLCPFFNFKSREFEGFCGKRDDPALPEKLIKRITAAIYKNGTQYPMDDIKSPDWCSLSRLDFDCKMDDIVYYKNTNLIIGRPVLEPDKLDIILDSYVKYTVGNKLIEFTPAKIEKSIPVPVLKICSSCGKDKDEVDRTKNMGLCNDCLSLINNDSEKIQLAYINNFRLKRKSTYSDLQFKIIKNNIEI